LTGIDIIAYNP